MSDLLAEVASVIIFTVISLAAATTVIVAFSWMFHFAERMMP